MKKILFALIAAMLAAGNWFSPAAAAEDCGAFYTVQNHETLIRIAEKCGTSVGEILVLNPQVANPNLIYDGQSLMLRGRKPAAVFVVYKTTSKTSYIVQEGDTWLKIATLYSTTIWDITQANPGMTFFTKLTPGMKLQIPAGTRAVKYTYTNDFLSSYPNARVTLSASSTAPGDDITAVVDGFPAGAYIDYRVGRSGSSTAYIYDGTTNDEGQASLTFEVPSKEGEDGGWVVTVVTTGSKDINVTAATSFSVKKPE